MEHINRNKLLIGIKDKNITINNAWRHEIHIELTATLDYKPPRCKHCTGKQIKYDFQKPSKIPFIEIANLTSLSRLKKRRFQFKNCYKVSVSETNLIKKIAHLLLSSESLTHITSR